LFSFREWRIGQDVGPVTINMVAIPTM